jgi:hypothetical protein
MANITYISVISCKFVQCSTVTLRPIKHILYHRGYAILQVARISKADSHRCPQSLKYNDRNLVFQTIMDLPETLTSHGRLLAFEVDFVAGKELKG